MTTTETTQTPAAPKSGKGVPVELPKNLTVSVSKVELPDAPRIGRTAAPNPFVDGVKLANANRDKTYQVPGIETEAQADRVKRLLAQAGGKDCSIRATYFPDADKPKNGVVRFKATDKITRERKPKPEAASTAPAAS